MIHSIFGHTHSEIIRNIKLVFRCDEEDIIDFRNVSEGMTNTSFIFKIDGIDYIYRHPGDGTESIINRRNEKKWCKMKSKVEAGKGILEHKCPMLNSDKPTK